MLASYVVFSLWPFTRLVHVWTAPVHYAVRRAHIIYRPAPTPVERPGAPAAPPA